MGKTRSYIFCLLAFVLAVSSPAMAVEWNISSSTNWSYMAFSQGGPNGFFGEYNIDNNTADPGAFASANGWLGQQVRHLVSGSGATTGSSSTIFFLNARVNQAVEVHGAVQVNQGDWAYYPGAIVSTAPVQFTNLFATVEAPIGVVSFGKKPFDFGTGLQYSIGNRSEEYLANVADYGPFQIGLGAYPWRVGDKLDMVRTTYWNPYDWGAMRRDVFTFLAYQNGPLDVGLGTVFAAFSQGPESQRNQVQRRSFPKRDTMVSEGWIYAKYFNGRFFLNAETDWYYRWDNFKRSLNSTFFTYPEQDDGYGSNFRPVSTESWRYAIQGGVVTGPAKFTVMYGNVPGPDRRNGVLNDRQGVVVDPDQRVMALFYYDPDLSNQTYFGPFSMILSDAYGAGVGAYGRNGMGFMADASVLAGRLDYALAANLNMYGTFMYAKRQSRSGYAMGSLTPQLTVDRVVTNIAVAGGAPADATGFDGAISYIVPRRFNAPNVPDDALGWEVNFGLDWELAQSWLISAKVGYWQPGKWFNYACIDRKVVGWNAPTADNGWGINPNRVIAPIYAASVNMSIGF